jgi:N-acetyl-gamma-glutamyl-phosphate reductase
VTRLHVVGAAGYAASEVVRIARHHPYLELGVLESRSHEGECIGDHAPLLRTLRRNFAPHGAALAATAAGDVVVLAGAADEARATAPTFLERGARVVDLSDAFRLHDHAGTAVYGLTERYRDAIRSANLVANPGCYPTATLLALWPLQFLAAGVTQIIVDAKSGITGAGRTPATRSLFAEVEGTVSAYALDGHRHESEMAQELASMGIDAPLLFTPHVVPIARGMLVDAYAILTHAPEPAVVRAAYAVAYAGNQFVRLLGDDRSPSLPAVARTNDAELHVSVRGRTIRVLCAIDNLGKGAAGQAVQNINVMLGFPEETALDDRTAAA